MSTGVPDVTFVRLSLISVLQRLSRFTSLIVLAGIFIVLVMSLSISMLYAQCSRSTIELAPCSLTATAFVGTSDTQGFHFSMTERTTAEEDLYCSYTGRIAGCSVQPTIGAGTEGVNSFTLSPYMAGVRADTEIVPAHITGGSSFSEILAGAGLTPDFTIDTTTINSTDQSLGLCANNCNVAMTSYSTIPFFTRNTPRSATLVYSEERIHPRPIIYADVMSSIAPTTYALSATLNGVNLQFLNTNTVLYFSGSTTPVRLAGQFDASSYATGIYTLVVTVTANYSGVPVTHSYTRPLIIVNESHSPFGRGWTLGGFYRLYLTGGKYLVTDGWGGATMYTALGTPAIDYSTLTWNAAQDYYDLATVDGSHIYFNSAGQMGQSRNRLDQTTKYDYIAPANQLLASISDPQRVSRGGVGPYIAFTYTGNVLSSIQEQSITGGRTTLIRTQPSDSAILRIVDPDGDSTRYTYDVNKRLSAITNRKGSVTTYQYNSTSWKVTEIDLPQVPVDAGGGSTVNAIPKIKYTPWMTLGVPISSTSSGSPATPIAVSSVKGTVIDPIGRVTTMTVDPWGQPLVIVDPASDTTKIVRKGVLPVKVVYPSGGVDTMAYVAGTPLVSYLKTAGDSIVNYHYGALNQIDSIWGPGLQSEYHFLNATTGRIDSMRYAGSNTLKSRFTYDAYNRLTSATDPSAHTKAYHYDPTFGNIDSVSSPGNLYTVRRFDAFGRDTTDVSRGSPVRQRITYDPLNRVTKMWHPGLVNDTTSIAYDALFPVRVKTKGGQIYKTETNVLGWVTKRYDSKDTTLYISYRYDTAGRMTSFTNRRGQRVTMTYDAMDRMLLRSDNTMYDIFSYGSAGRSVTTTRPGVSTDVMWFNKNGMTDSIVRNIANHHFVIQYLYTSTNTGVRRTVAIANDAGISFSQETDVVHSVTGAADSITLTGSYGNGTTTINNNLDHLPTGILSPGAYSTLSYTTRHQAMTAGPDGFHAPLSDSLWRSYTYDTLGRLAGDQRAYNYSTARNLDRSFAYDSLGQFLWSKTMVDSACTATLDTLVAGYKFVCTHLSTVTQDSAQYDAAGNRLFSGASYSAMGNRLLTGPSGISYTFDADGNMVTRTHGGVTDSLYWSASGLLDSVASGGSGGLRRRYEYNGWGQLVRRQTAVGTGAYSIDRYFLWDGTQMIAELIPGYYGPNYPQLLAQYIYRGVDQPFAIVTDTFNIKPRVRYYHQDPIEGNLTGIMRDNSTLLQYTQYSAWGQILQRPINSMADTNRLGWKGLMYEGDSTRLYYVRNRWYDPAVGRFISEDPIGLAGGTNLYAFGDNDPINHSDPSGTTVNCQDYGHMVNAYVNGYYDSSGWISDWQCTDNGSSWYGPSSGFPSTIPPWVFGGGKPKKPAAKPKPKSQVVNPVKVVDPCTQASDHAAKSLTGDLALLLGLKELASTATGVDELAPIVAKNYGSKIARTVRINRTMLAALGVMGEYILGPERLPTESILYSVPISGSFGRLIDQYAACVQ